jgi:hypothetical protein
MRFSRRFTVASLSSGKKAPSGRRYAGVAYGAGINVGPLFSGTQAL